MKAISLRGALAAVVILAASSAFAGPNLIVNGDFAAPNVGLGWNEWSPGTTQTGWTSANDAIEIGHSTTNYGLPCVTSGCQNLEVNANTWGDDYQTVTGLTVGDWYTLSYLYGGRTSGGPDALDVYFGGVHLTTDSGSVGSWTLNTFTVRATDTSEKLEFISQVTSGNPGYGNEITAVSLSTPEASTWAMMGLGFAGLGLVGFRVRRTATA
jgi:hypothetical protein